MQIIRTIARLERLYNSVNDNPRWRVHWTDGTENVTQSDASVNYVLDNSEYKDVPLLVTLTKAGRITHVENATKGL